MNNKLFIVIPAYNEEANIENVIREWHPVIKKTSPKSRLVIFNDGSTDKTYDIMQRLKNSYSQFTPITKPNSGHGSTCLFAYNYGISSDADYIFQTDSDGQTNPEEFWEFWRNRSEFDFIIGYRKNRKDGLSRTVVTKILKMLIWIIFGEKIKDSNTPFRLMNVKKLKPILRSIPEDFFLANVIISLLVVKRKEKHLWLPITFKDRQGGVNSIDLKKIFKIGIKSISDFKLVKSKIEDSQKAQQ